MTALDGRRVAVTSARRSEELATLLERRGAKVSTVAAVRSTPVEDDTDLLATTDACIAAPPDVLAVATGAGLRMWLDRARERGRYDDLVAALHDTAIIARGPKAVGAIRGAGLREAWVAPSGSMDEVYEHLAGLDLADRTLVLQEYGQTSETVLAALRSSAREVRLVTAYVARPAESPELDDLVRDVSARRYDAVTFTSAIATEAVLLAGRRAGVTDALVDALRGDVVAACVGPITAGPLLQLGIPALQPERARLVSLVQALTDRLG